MRGTVASIRIGDGTGSVRAVDGREFFFHRSGAHEIPYESLAFGAAVEFDVGHEPGDAVGEAPRALRIRVPLEPADAGSSEDSSVGAPGAPVRGESAGE